MIGNIEMKVAVPVIATALTGTLGAALYRTLLAFGWFHPTAQQTISLAALGAAVLVVVQAVTGYASPHTPRPDLRAAGVVAGPATAVPVVSAGDAATPQPRADSSVALADPPPPADSYPDTPPAPAQLVADTPASASAPAAPPVPEPAPPAPAPA